jgi:hypothetical protein
MVVAVRGLVVGVVAGAVPGTEGKEVLPPVGPTVDGTRDGGTRGADGAVVCSTRGDEPVVDLLGALVLVVECGPGNVEDAVVTVAG